MGGNTDNDIVVLVKDLSSFGIPYSGKHIRDLVKRGSFPVPFKLSERRLAWWKSEIVAYLRERAALTHGQISEQSQKAGRKGYAALAANRAARHLLVAPGWYSSTSPHAICGPSAGPCAARIVEHPQAPALSLAK
jgi:predicted DNA-binding transcriptional regulator AlpA